MNRDMHARALCMHTKRESLGLLLSRKRATKIWLDVVVGPLHACTDGKEIWFKAMQMVLGPPILGQNLAFKKALIQTCIRHKLGSQY